jgi:exo-beta-1,3-glucanase (GH17 family)
MKAAFVAAAAAAVLSGGVSAGHAHARHAHDLFKVKRNDTAVCTPGCTTVYTTITGSAGLWTPPAVPSTSITSIYVNTTSALPTTTPAPVVPVTTTTPTTTPAIVAQTCPTPGTYTLPATTVVVTETEYVCGASSTSVPAGTHTLGGVTTVVETATTVVCPYATSGVVSTTTYVCPSAGTYTIAPITTVVVEETLVVVPVVQTYAPGTYTAPSVVTVVETATVIYCPLTSSTSAPAPAAPAATTTYVVAAVPASSAPASTSSAAQPSSTGSGAQLGGGKNLGITYTPYTSTGDCKSADAVLAEIEAIAAAGINTVRVYSTDCDTLPNVGAAAEAHGVKIIAGIFVNQPGCTNDNPTLADQISALKSWAQWDIVPMIVVGNEAMFNNYCTPTELRDLILHVKSELGSVGYTGLYTTTDVVSAWITMDVSPVCEVIDVVGTNAHAYFNAGTTPDQAGDFVAGQLKIVEAACGGKTGYVLESGWPTAGKCYGLACPGSDEQRTAVASIQSVIGDRTILFSLHDDKWKQPGDCGCEQNWGCGTVLGISLPSS